MEKQKTLELIINMCNSQDSQLACKNIYWLCMAKGITDKEYNYISKVSFHGAYDGGNPPELCKMIINYATNALKELT
jgi:hypothetical protein